MTTGIAKRSEPDLTERRRRRARTLIFLVAANLVGVLAALPWNHFAVNIEGVPGFSLDRTAIQSPDASLGIAALVLSVLLATGAAAGQVGRAPWADQLRRAETVLPPVLALTTLALLGIKAVVRSDFLGAGAWIALVLAALLTYGTLQLRLAGRSRSVVAPRSNPN